VNKLGGRIHQRRMKNVSPDKELTFAQEKFLQYLVIEGMPKVEAYKKAYPTSFNSNNSTVAKRLWATLQMPNVVRRRRELMATIEEKTGITVEYVANQFLKLQEMCMQPIEIQDRFGKPTGISKPVDAQGANAALTSLGKYLKMFVDKHEITANVNITKLEDILE
jgi:hypothetical protein